MTNPDERPSSSHAEGRTSPWIAFRYRAFTVVWIATVVANVGTWMYNAASGWLMTSLNPDPLTVSLVQVAGSLPKLLSAFPAGALVAAAGVARERASAGASDRRPGDRFPACPIQCEFARNAHKSGSILLLRKRLLGAAPAGRTQSDRGRPRALRHFAGSDRHRRRRRRLHATLDEGGSRIRPACCGRHTRHGTQSGPAGHRP